MINFHAPAREQRREPDSPPRCANPGCGNIRKRQKDGVRWQGAHGWCGTCSSRWYQRGMPPEGPGVPMTAQERTAISGAMSAAAFQARFAEYTRMRRNRYTPVQAVRVMRLSDRTRFRYERKYAAMEEAA